MADLTNLIEKLKDKLKSELVLSENGQAIYCEKNIIVQLIKLLKEEFDYWMLEDVTSADYETYYEVIYHLADKNAELLAVKVKIDKEDSSIPSVSSIFKAADPMEREIFDLMGIVFEGHGNLKRILCPEDFIGHPLQKSFKLDKVDRF